MACRNCMGHCLMRYMSIHHYRSQERRGRARPSPTGRAGCVSFVEMKLPKPVVNAGRLWIILEALVVDRRRLFILPL